MEAPKVRDAQLIRGLSSADTLRQLHSVVNKNRAQIAEPCVALSLLFFGSGVQDDSFFGSQHAAHPLPHELRAPASRALPALQRSPWRPYQRLSQSAAVCERGKCRK